MSHCWHCGVDGRLAFWDQRSLGPAKQRLKLSASPVTALALLHLPHLRRILALRLASLEQYLEKNEPLPFIVDDILLRFDDDRALATLKVLADLSRKTQVLFFTHHRHLVELADNAKELENRVCFNRL